jgi:hypothetical protein
MKNAVFWDVAACRSCMNRRFAGTYRLHLQGRKIRERGTSVSRWLQPRSPSCKTSVHTRSTRRHIPEDGILHSHRRENLILLIALCSITKLILLLGEREYNKIKDLTFRSPRPMTAGSKHQSVLDGLATA